MNFTCEPLVSEVLGAVDATRIRSLVYAKHTLHSSATIRPVAYTSVFTVLAEGQCADEMLGRAIVDGKSPWLRTFFYAN